MTRIGKFLAAIRASLRGDYGEYPPGHFYSPIPDLAEIRARSATKSTQAVPCISGVDLNADGQLATLRDLARFYNEFPYSSADLGGYRYHPDNSTYPMNDAVFMYCMLRWVKPKRLIEVGSGFSSAVVLDTNERFLNEAIDVTCIDPHPARLLNRMTMRDHDLVNVVSTPVQEVSLDEFRSLAEGDVLIIDSTHVAKIGSDVNCIFFDILPALQSGVLVHFHDVFFPFEYPQIWLDKGRFWNESYLLHAFLQYNSAFEIVIWNHFLATFYCDELRAAFPLCAESPGGELDWYLGGALWLRRK